MLVVKNLHANAGDMRLQVRSLGQEDPRKRARQPAHSKCSCLKNPMDRGAWQATVPEVTRVGHDLSV